jgi:hypothetical protein
MAMIGAGGAEQLGADEEDTTGIEDKLEDAAVVSHVQGGWEVGDTEGEAAWVKYVVAMFAGGRSITGVEGAAETGATRVINNVAVANAMSHKIRERTAVADTAGVGATGVTACTIAANANLMSVNNVVIIVAVAVVDEVSSTIIGGEVAHIGR